MLRHWIYVLSEGELLEQARAWEQRKTAAGKWYRVLDSSANLQEVGNDDVLYVMSPTADSLDAAELAGRLQQAGLHTGHRVVKIFASRSGDGTNCFAERLYTAMVDRYPNVVVYGYLGQVSAAGYSGHKTAGMDSSETLEAIDEDDWNARGLRAKENRVRFPAGPVAGE